MVHIIYMCTHTHDMRSLRCKQTWTLYFSIHKRISVVAHWKIEEHWKWISLIDIAAAAAAAVCVKLIALTQFPF